MACGLVIAVRGWRSGRPWLDWSEPLKRLPGWLSLLAMPAAIGFYLLAAERLGFLPTAAILVAALCAWLWGAAVGRALDGCADRLGGAMVLWLTDARSLASGLVHATGGRRLRR